MKKFRIVWTETRLEHWETVIEAETEEKAWQKSRDWPTGEERLISSEALDTPEWVKSEIVS